MKMIGYIGILLVILGVANFIKASMYGNITVFQKSEKRIAIYSGMIFILGGIFLILLKY